MAFISAQNLQIGSKFDHFSFFAYCFHDRNNICSRLTSAISLHVQVQFRAKIPSGTKVWSGTKYVAMVTKLSSSYCGAHLEESYCKESNISDSNWLRYPSLAYLIKIWLSV